MSSRISYIALAVTLFFLGHVVITQVAITLASWNHHRATQEATKRLTTAHLQLETE